MTEQPRNWDKELADIDRVIEKVPAPAAVPAKLPPPGSPPVAKGSVAMTWFWAVLALLLAVALPLWPYGKECGLQLFFYLGAAALALLAGAAGAVSSWATRRGLAHLLSLLALLWAGVMGAREVLPRAGYAVQAKPWLCPATPEPAPPASAPTTGP
ncbi:MAG: hypothetical protein H0T50_09120 [Gemmatimonadales bacterium]|nr:hypothetical protein [Gemmatimonadales bacterium]